MSDYKDIIGRHLGRTASGELMTPYEAPKVHDPSLLVPIPRDLGREKSGFTHNTAMGFDVWHAYEFSFLNKNNQPITGILKFSFSSLDTHSMIESKSFKLYLNSFDFEAFDSVEDVLETIYNDISAVCGGSVSVDFHPATVYSYTNELTHDVEEIFNNYIAGSIDNLEITGISFDESTDHLKTLVPNINRDEIIYFHTSNLRSACEITNQKDTGHCFIALSGTNVFDRRELGRYIFSLRDAQHFHENVTEIIYHSLIERYSPDNLLVANIYNRRGGLDIHPVRFNNIDFATEVWPIEHLGAETLIQRITSQV